MKTRTLLVMASFLALLPSVGNGQEIIDEWRYTLRRPAEGWRQANFDDVDWTEGFGGFGTRGTPGARIGTAWATNSIWLRKSFELESVPAKPALLVHHDEDAEVYINGKQVAKLTGFVGKYIVLPIDQEKTSSLKAGQNTMAVHCKQTTGGQFIDVHVVDADNVPTLPKPKRSTKPFQSELITEWGAKVTPENVWTEYPRPRMKRDEWMNLNGNWDYAVTPIDVKEAPAEWIGKVLVPYCLESKLGGVQRLLDASEALWYHRTFALDQKPAGRKWFLNFEAVDYRCEVFVNGQSVGEHVGGNGPFSFDITAAVNAGENTLVVRVEDATEEYQLRGKQVINARGIWYTQVSGIWQTVWLEEVASEHIEDVKISTSAKAGSITVETKTNSDSTIEVIVKDGDQEVARVKGGKQATIRLQDAKLWSPSSPHLYDVTVNLLGAKGQVIDSVESYAGIRDVGKVKDADGHWRFTLNGEILFHWGPLDQGWWPDGLLTPPSDEAMLFDIEWLKAAGFNMIRKHIKVEPRRYYYHCDRLGMMVWQDQVSGGVGSKAWPQWTRLKPNPVDAKWPPKQHQQFMLELDRMITSLESHPSIVSWVPFNERWGQHKTMEVGKWTVERDPSRIINIASGGNFWPVGDVVDAHKYPHPEFPFDDGAGGRFDDYIKVMGEFGGHGYPVKGHLWDQNRRNWGYGGLPENETEYKERYTTSLRMLNDLRGQGIAGGVYTQTTDVEGEINGLMTYDRKVIKIPAKELAELHKTLLTNVAQSASLKSEDSGKAILGAEDYSLAPHGNGNVYAPDIVKHNGEYLMYYGAQGRDGHDRICLATSPDGIDWEKQGVVFAPEGVNHVNDPSVLVVGGTWKMYYTRAGTGVTDAIGYAISEDGVHWVDKGVVFSAQGGTSERGDRRWDSLLVGRPSVLFEEGKYKLWYDGRADLPPGAPDPTAPKSPTSKRFVGFAESIDGITWNRRDKPVFANDAGGVHVSRVGDRLVMVVEGRTGTAWAESTDGIHWTDMGLLQPKQKESPHGHVTPFLATIDDQYRLFYGAAAAANWNQNSIATVLCQIPVQRKAAAQFRKSAFREVPTDRKPGPVMRPEVIRAGLKSHDKALYIKSGWIRDPYITLGPDDYYYLTGTQPKEGDPREAENPYNIGLGDASIVGHQVRLWRSKDLIDWESLGPIFTVDETMKKKGGKKSKNRYIWAPEVHWLADKERWALVHCPKVHSSLALTDGVKLKGPWTHPMNGKMGPRHDPSIFTDDDGQRYLLWGNTFVAPLSDDLTSYTADPVRIDPAGSRPGPDGTPINRIGHEGATMIKVGDKYVHLGTAWSTDQGRKGSYNLYYCVANKITGPYGPRKFAGRFLGHGTPFKDREGKWWCTAFFNGNVPPESREGIQERDLGDNARTINEQGVTIVPLDIRILDDGGVYIRAKDPAYAKPGPDEAQKFTP